MNIVVTVLQIVAPVFILAGIGFAWVRAGWEYRVAFVTRLAMTLAVPCLIFTSLMKTQIAPSALSTVALATLAAYAMVTITMFVVVRVGGLPARTYLSPLIFGNTGNLGLPLALFAFGEEGLGYAVVIFAIMAVYSFTVGLWIVAGGGSAIRVFKEPTVGASVLGGVFLIQGWTTPLWLTNTLELIGQMAIPLMLITLGVAIGRLRASGYLRAIVLSFLKFLICAALAWLAADLLQMGPVPAAVLIVQVSTPVAVTSYLLAEKYGADAEQVAGLVVVSTLMSVALIPFLLAFLI